MALLNAQAQKQVREALTDLPAPVKLVVFTHGEGGALECDFCAEMRQLVEELAALSDQLTVEIRDFVGEAEAAKSYGVDKIPALAVVRGGAEPKDFGVRFYGIPSGYEFATLIEDIRLVSRGQPDLAPQTVTLLNQLRSPVRIQVYVTPTCPYCPRAVLLAHKLAMASEWVTADMVEAQEFPHLANRYQVYGVPRTVIDDVIHVEGAVPEEMLVSHLAGVLDAEAMSERRAEWQARLN
jgi:glutaredoxin-like protein